MSFLRISTLVLASIGLLGLTSCGDRGESGPSQESSASSFTEDPTWKPRDGSFEQVQTKHGVISVGSVKDASGVETRTLVRNGTVLHDQGDFSLFIHSVYDRGDTTALLISVGSGGMACPAEFRFITVGPGGDLSTTDTFGTCSDLPEVAVVNDSITVSLPSMQGVGNESWEYTNGGLKKTQERNLAKLRSAPVFTFEERIPAQVRGTVKKKGETPDDWVLSLPEPTLLNANGSPSCDKVWDSITIAPEVGRTLRESTAPEEFMATIECPGFGPYITALQTAKAYNEANQRMIFGQWECTSVQSGARSKTFILLKEDGLFSYVIPGQLEMTGYNLASQGSLASGDFSEVVRGQRRATVAIPVRFEFQAVNASKLGFRMDIAGAQPVSIQSECGPLLPAQASQNTAPVNQGGVKASSDVASRYAESLAMQLSASGNPACAAIASNLRMLGASSAPEQIRMRQVDALFDKAPSFCLR